MMSARFWLFSLACAGAALTGGFGLGFYATTPPKIGTETVLPEAVPPDGSDHDLTSTDLTGPAIIHCKGCGPTLADRRMAVDMVDMAGGDGTNDPMMRDYAAQDEVIPTDEAEPPPAVRTLPESIERFAAGEGEDAWGSVRVAQVQNDKTPAEEAPADVAVSY
ncbi:hypothetical protein [Sphingobium sp.]|uniref:hypothetical protein n=1 Tax=Sphingobium sp. TaxID=1912891 RepID=UPI0028BEF197|nr:hypothetical protein [Sphingobium sp.]